MARPDGWYSTSPYASAWVRGVMSSIWPDPMAAFSSRAAWENTMALPTGRPQEKYVGAAVPGGRCAVLPTPRTSSPSRRTRSPIGPHEKGPGSVTSNRHVRLVPSGATAHALPPETNATVSTAAGLPFAQPDGNEATRAVAAGAGEAVGVGDREVD